MIRVAATNARLLIILPHNHNDGNSRNSKHKNDTNYSIHFHSLRQNPLHEVSDDNPEPAQIIGVGASGVEQGKNEIEKHFISFSWICFKAIIGCNL
jgi:hypothetical protein